MRQVKNLLISHSYSNRNVQWREEQVSFLIFKRPLQQGHSKFGVASLINVNRNVQWREEQVSFLIFKRPLQQGHSKFGVASLINVNYL